MKRKIRILATLVFCLSGLFNSPEANAIPDKDKDGSSGTPTYIPIVVRKDIPLEHPRMPAMGITVNCKKMGSVLIIENHESISASFVEIEQLSSPYGYWTSTFIDAGSCEMYFDGTDGDYKMTLTDGETSYIGYFTL